MEYSTAQQPTADGSSASSSSPTPQLQAPHCSAIAATSQQPPAVEVATDEPATVRGDQHTTADLPAVEDEPRLSAEEKGKGRAAEPAEEEVVQNLQSREPPQADPHHRYEAHDLAESLSSAISLPASDSPPPFTTPVELSHSSPDTTPSSPPPHVNDSTPASSRKAVPLLPEPEVAEERWPLKSISWPPLPPTPSSNHQQIETMGPTIKIVCQNLNGPCSFIALCEFWFTFYQVAIRADGSLLHR